VFLSVRSVALVVASAIHSIVVAHAVSLKAVCAHVVPSVTIVGDATEDRANRQYRNEYRRNELHHVESFANRGQASERFRTTLITVASVDFKIRALCALSHIQPEI
jgi:hypothetical protein